MKKLILFIGLLLFVVSSYAQQKVYGNLKVYGSEWVRDTLWYADSTYSVTAPIGGGGGGTTKDTSYAHIVANRPNKLDTIFKNIDLIANTTLFPKGTYFTINKGSYTATTNILRDSCTLEFKDGSKVTKSNSGALFRNRHFTGYSDILGLGTFVTTDTLYNCSTSDGTNGKSIIINAKSMTTSASGCIYIVSAYVTSVKFKSDVVCTGGDALNITIHGSAIVEDFSSVGITSTVGYGIKNEYNIGVNGFGFRIKGHNVTSSSAYEAIYSAFNNYWGYPVNIDVDYISGTKAIFANGYFYSGVMSRIYGNITGDINVNNTDCNISGSITNGVVYGGNTSGTLTVYSNCKNVGFVGNLVVKGAVMNDISYWTNHTFFVGFFANAKTTFDAPIVISNSNTSSNVLIDNGQYNYYPANVTFNGTVTFTGNYTYVPTVVSSGALRINNDFINLGTTTTNTMIQIYGASIRIGANAKIINNSAIAGTGCIVHNASGYWVGNNSQFCYGGIMKSTGDCIQSTTTVDVYNYQNYFANHGRSVTGIGAYVEKITGGGTEIIDADVQ